MTHSNEQWFSLDGQLIDEKLVFNINELNGSARYEKNFICSYCKGSGRHRISYANSLGKCTSCKGTGKQGSLIKECFTLQMLFKKNYLAAKKVLSSSSWRQNHANNLSALEKQIISSSNKNPFLKSLTLTLQSGRHLSIKQIAVAERILSQLS
ncbi:YuiA family protein [Klebsiella pneumoniae]|uniref:YuiA family protein n=1 Tax=Klebsiella pneumoniae TaxID=573 RepID=UPI001D18F679|nr:YuiA family protein [Klebsiella pneumoniae]